MIYLSNSKNKIDVKYELEDKRAKVEIIENESLNVGQNEVIIKVVAENGDEQDYIIMIEKCDKIEENISNIIGIIVGIGIFGGISYLIYSFIKKIKRT